MNMENFCNEMLDFQEGNEDFIRLFENYLHSEIYLEIKEFLNIAHPNWRKNKELGSWAPEYILQIIDLWSDEESERPFCQWLTCIYQELDASYFNYKNDFQATRRDELRKIFEQEEGDNFNGIYTWAEYDKLFDDFVKKNDEEIVWSF